MSRLYSLYTKFFLKKEEGATMVEYGLMLALIAIVCIAAVTLLGSNVKTIFNNAATSLQSGT